MKGNLILCDFGVSQFFKSQHDLLVGTKGTMRFMAPEVVQTGADKILHGKHVDVWALGITVYNMLTNEFPFSGKSIAELQQELLHKTPDLSKTGQFSELIKGILEKQIDKRTTINELITHPLLTDNGRCPIELDLSFSLNESDMRGTYSFEGSVKSLQLGAF